MRFILVNDRIFQLNASNVIWHTKSDDLLATVDQCGTVIFWHTAPQERISEKKSISRSMIKMNLNASLFSIKRSCWYGQNQAIFYIDITQLESEPIPCFQSQQENGIQRLAIGEKKIAIVSRESAANI